MGNYGYFLELVAQMEKAGIDVAAELVIITRDGHPASVVEKTDTSIRVFIQDDSLTELMILGTRSLEGW